MHIRCFILAATFFFNFAVEVFAAPSPIWTSVAAAIYSANAQARLTLSPGVWRTIVGTASLTWEILHTNHANLVIEYDENQVSTGSIAFDSPIFVTVKTPDGVCAKIEVTQINYKYGGGFDGKSGIKMVGPANCRDVNGVALMEDHLKLTNRPDKLFAGLIFAVLANSKATADPNKATVVKCTDVSCANKSVDRGPVTNVSFYGMKKNGQKYLPFHADLRPGATISLPKGGYFKVCSAAGLPGQPVCATNNQKSGVDIDQLDYDVVQDQGSGSLRALQIYMSEGQASAGNALLKFPNGSAILFNSVVIGKAADGVSITDGSFAGSLGRGSVIVLNEKTEKPSLLTIDQTFQVSLIGLSARFSPSEEWLGAQSGTIDAMFSGADIYFSNENNVKISYTRVLLSLGCQGSSPPSCLPIRWSPSGTTLSGTISPFSADIIGGKFSLSKSMKVDIQNGFIKAKLLTVDTSNAVTPITGSIDQAQVTFTAQDLSFDDGTRVRGSKVVLTSNDLTFTKGDRYPSGSLEIPDNPSSPSGITEINAPKFGGFTFENATITARLKRSPNDDPHVDSGTIKGVAIVRFADNRYGRVNVTISNMQYYRGQGSAKLDLVTAGFAYGLTIPPPADKDEESGGVIGVKAHVHVSELPVDLTLAAPVEVHNVELRASDGYWSLSPIAALPISLNAHVSDREAVYVQVKEKATGINVCNPKLNTNDHNYILNGLLDLTLGSNGASVNLHDLHVSEGLLTHAVATCDDAAKVLCWLIGTGATGSPLAGVGLAVFCGKEVAKKEAEAIDQIRDKSREKINSFHFQSH